MANTNHPNTPAQPRWGVTVSWPGQRPRQYTLCGRNQAHVIDKMLRVLEDVALDVLPTITTKRMEAV